MFTKRHTIISILIIIIAAILCGVFIVAGSLMIKSDNVSDWTGIFTMVSGGAIFVLTGLCVFLYEPTKD